MISLSEEQIEILNSLNALAEIVVLGGDMREVVSYIDRLQEDLDKMLELEGS